MRRFFHQARRVLAGLFLTCLAGTALADNSRIEQVRCPVGGALFEVTRGGSCMTLGRSMSFRPVTSCDEMTQLPICPDTGLPVYKKFSAQDISRLESYLRSAEYDALRAKPDWMRAYRVARHLGDAGTHQSFNVVLGHLWFDGGSFFESSGSVNRFLYEVSSELARTDAHYVPYLESITAYVLTRAGRIGDAQVTLDALRARADLPPELVLYIAAISRCLDDRNRADCGPDVMFTH